MWRVGVGPDCTLIESSEWWFPWAMNNAISRINMPGVSGTSCLYVLPLHEEVGL